MVVELKIDPEFEQIIAPPTKNELELLEKSLKEGYDKSFPIIVWVDTIVDGHNRYRICKKYNIEPEIQKIEFKSRDEALIWIIDRQIQRRNISKKYWNFLVGERLRLSTRSTAGRPKSGQNEPINDDESKIKTIDEIADEMGVSRSTAKRKKEDATELYHLAKDIGINQREIVDSSKNPIDAMNGLKQFDKKQQIKFIQQAKDKKTTIEKIIETAKLPEPPKQPERNERGVLIALPEKVSMRMVKIKPEHMDKNEDDKKKCLQCDIYVDDTLRECYVFSLENEDNFMFVLPNIKNLILDFNEIFTNMTPIVSYRPVEDEYLKFTRSFPLDQWNNFVESRFPDLMINEESEEPEAHTTDGIPPEDNTKPIKPEEAPLEPEHTVSGESQAPVEAIETQHDDTHDKPFSLYIGTRDMGIIEIINNDEPSLSMQCHAMPKEQDNTELWDNRKHELILTFEEELSPNKIVEMADKTINDYLDKEEHLPPNSDTFNRDKGAVEIVKEKKPVKVPEIKKPAKDKIPKVKPKQEPTKPVKPETATKQQDPVKESVKDKPKQELVKTKTAKASVQKAKTDVKPKEKPITSEEKKEKQNYTQYDSHIQKCLVGKSLNRLDIIEALGLKDRYESLDKKGKHAMEEGFYKRCNKLVEKGILEIDEIASKEKGSAHYIAKTQSIGNIKSEKMSFESGT